MTCVQVKSLLSSYLDGTVTGKQMHALGQHLNECVECRLQYQELRQTQALLSRVGRARVPDDLSLKVRLAISREAARRREPVFSGLGIRVANALRAFMVPATAGVVATLIIFGVLMGFITPVQANTNEVLLLSTDPEIQQTGFGGALASTTDESFVIEAYVDANGRVQDYRILSDPDRLKDIPHSLKNLLIFTTFKPATLMGSPRPGTAVLSFSKISVKG
jgi:putative zinc finger protein